MDDEKQRMEEFFFGTRPQSREPEQVCFEEGTFFCPYIEEALAHPFIEEANFSSLPRPDGHPDADVNDFHLRIIC